MIKIAVFVEQYMQNLANDINNSLTSENVNITGPTFRKRENNITLSYNIYPIETRIEELWTLLHNLLTAKFKELSKQGEVIMYSTTQGSILDQGIEYFKVQKGTIFECYIYEPESFIYTRLLQEFDVLKKTQWISIDLDGIEQSAWFEE